MNKRTRDFVAAALLIGLMLLAEHFGAIHLTAAY